jgi:hypothetical protein
MGGSDGPEQDRLQSIIEHEAPASSALIRQNPQDGKPLNAGVHSYRRQRSTRSCATGFDVPDFVLFRTTG